MLGRLLPLLLLLTGIALAQPQDLLLRVLLTQGASGSVSVAAHQRITNLGGQLYSAGTVSITAGAGEIVVDGQGQGPWVEFAAQDGFSLNGRPYRGNLLAVWQDGQVLFINKVWLEDYLLGVVPSEVPASFPAAVLQAQAILARTFALYRLNPTGLYDICASERCQVYLGRSAEQAPQSDAVYATRSLIVSYNQKPITAVYHADSGGYIASASEVWGQAYPYLLSKPDPYSQSPGGSWTRAITPTGVAGALANMGLSAGAVQALQILQYNESGRPSLLRVIGSARSLDLDSLGATKLLRGLGMPSTRVQIHGWQIVGQGNGHGVGMSQWGARGLAMQGWDFRQLLGYYYPGTFLSSFSVVAGLQDKLYAMGYTPALAQK
ncbi:MAG: stage II sporulation protein SpoIID [Meiothermus sp.]